MVSNAHTPPFAHVLSSYSTYLTLLSRVQIGRRLQGKVDPADVVQETLMEAHRQLPHFRGKTEAELLAWLRKILAGQIAKTLRRYLGVKGRDVGKEVDQELDRSNDAMGALAASASTPSHRAARKEQAVLLAEALAKLPQTYRDVILLRHIEQMSFAEIARRLNRTDDSVQKLWVRALGTLRRTLGDQL